MTRPPQSPPPPAKPRKRRPKKEVFSAVKAVKANARERLGTPPADRVIPDAKRKAAQKAKRNPTLAELLSAETE